jgi:Zn-finger nucleic acid-binding protein
MKCPACARAMTEIKVEDFTVNACQGGCGGIWFDAHELQKVEYQDEAAGEPLLRIERDDSVVVDTGKKRNCPRCDMIMMRHFSSPTRRVTIDDCPKCTGVWLDAGELAEIRSEFKSEAQRQANTEKFFNDVFATQLNSMHQHPDSVDRTGVARMDRISKALSLLSPGNYFKK